ncbi:MAG: putative Ig domain-containing protein, partial [Acidobacteriia bacterium]|nr:putative Ig domain-containing protein [Terriglobia bacterium]
WSLEAGSLPPGISLVSSGDTVSSNLAPGVGYIVGKPLQTGTYTFTLRVTDAVAATATQTFTWPISAINLQYTSLPVRDNQGNLFVSALTRGVAYSQPLLAIGGTSAYTWTATMPAGLTLDASTGMVGGTPLDTGTFNVPITIVDNDGHSFLGNENIIISPAAGTVTFGVGATQTLVQGSSASINLSPSGGTAPYTVTALTPLPPGFALETGNAVLGTATPGSSFFLAGAPMAAGVFTVTLQAQDFGGNIGERTFTLTVVPVANFTGNTLADGSVGAPYSAQLVWFDNAGTLTWSVTPGSALPAGLTLSSAGLLSGTPASAGSYSFNATVRDSATGLSTNPSISVKISPLAIMGSDFLPIATVTQPYSYTFAATGAGSVSWSISTSGLPNGLSVSQATGTISGTPLSGAGTVTITVTATNGPNSVTRRFTLFVRPVNLLPPNLPLLQTALPDGTVGQLYSASISPNGGLPPYTWSVASGSLPPGLSLLSGAQIPPTSFPGLTFIGGLPTVAGQYSFDLVLTDANGAQSVRTFSVNVSAINILSGQPRTAITGQAYAQQFTVVGGTAPYTFTASRQPASPTADLLPPGITLSASGLLSGTTTSTGVYTFVIRAQDAAGNSFARTAQLVVNSPSGLRVQSGNPGDVYVGSGFFQSLVTNGGSTYSWSVSGALPPGLSIVTDPAVPTSTTLIGQPSVAGGYTYTLRATDTANGANFADRTFTMNVSPMQVVTPPLLNFIIPNAQAGVAYSTTVKVAGGTPPYSFSASSAAPIPPGLTLGADGTLSGTPTQVGSFSIGLIATDAAGRVYHLPAPTLVVTPAGTPGPIAAVQNVQTMDDASVGVPYRFALVQDRGGVAPFSWTVLSPLPPGLAIVSGSNGVPDHLAGVPTTAGSYSFKLTVTDSIGQSVPVSYLLNVSPLALTPDSLAPGRVGVAYMASLAPVGGVGPYAIQALSDWDLPPGLTLSPAGVLSGTPTAPGLFAMRVVVTDNASHTLSRMFVVYVDNAIGESPAVTFVPRSIQLSYTQTFPDPGAIAVGVNTTSGTPAYNVAIEGIPGATLSAPGGTAPGSVSLDLHVTTLGVGTYSGVLALKSAPTTNEYDVIPVTVTVAALPQCTYDVSPASTTIGAAGGAGTFDLSTAGHCSWTASVSQPSWISLTSAASGTGAATIGFRIASNPFASQRSGTITVNGGVYTISQFGSACSFVINPISLSAPAGGGITSVGVTASDSICGWSASSLDLGVSPAAGSGNGTVTVTIPPNLAAGVRQLTASIAGQTFTVNQQGVDCTVAVDPSSASFSDAGGLGSSTITTPAACGYDTTSTPSWVTITSGGSSLSGSGTLQYTVNANSATTPRTGSIVVGGQTLTISQGAAACSVTLDTAALGSPFGTGAGSGAIGVIANGDNCAWSVSGSANWVTFAPNAASGSGTVSIGVAANLLVLSRTATVAIAGQMVTISQSGQACSYALQSSTGSVPAAGGSGTVGVLTPAACSWNPVSSDPTWLSVGPGSTGSGDASFVATANPNPSPRAATVTIA